MQQEFDYIIIGGGSAGCVLASRLSEDPTISVCLLEAGGQGNAWTVNIPAACVMSLPTKINNWAFETVPQKGLNGRKGYQPRGKCLGGSSAINAMIYIRGNRADYDDWAAQGCTGWSYDEVCHILSDLRITIAFRMNIMVMQALYMYPMCKQTVFSMSDIYRQHVSRAIQCWMILMVQSRKA